MLPAGHSSLRFALLLSAVLVGVVVVQLLLCWLTLARLLQRTAAHPLARAFAALPEFARVTIDGQMSDTLLRWVLCARQLGALVQQLPASNELECRARCVSQTPRPRERISCRARRKMRKQASSPNA